MASHISSCLLGLSDLSVPERCGFVSHGIRGPKACRAPIFQCALSEWRGMCGRGEVSFRFTAALDACPGNARHFTAHGRANNIAERDIHDVLVLEIDKYPALYKYSRNCCN